MKHLLYSFALLGMLATLAVAQPAETNSSRKAFGSGAETNAPLRISSTQVKEHIGARALVTGKVAEVNQARGLVRLNFDKPFPEQSFTAVIFSRYTNQFSNLEALKGKQVEVRGKIILYRSRPEIQLQGTNQLTVLGEAGDGEHN